MRDTKGRFKEGYSGNSRGRPRKADEQVLVELWDDFGKDAFSEAIKERKNWAVKLLVNKLFATPKAVDFDEQYQDKSIQIFLTDFAK